MVGHCLDELPLVVKVTIADLDPVCHLGMKVEEEDLNATRLVHCTTTEER